MHKIKIHKNQRQCFCMMNIYHWILHKINKICFVKAYNTSVLLMKIFIDNTSKNIIINKYLLLCFQQNAQTY